MPNSPITILLPDVYERLAPELAKICGLKISKPNSFGNRMIWGGKAANAEFCELLNKLTT